MLDLVSVLCTLFLCEQTVILSAEGAWGTHGGDKKCIQGFGGEIRRTTANLKTQALENIEIQSENRMEGRGLNSSGSDTDKW